MKNIHKLCVVNIHYITEERKHNTYIINRNYRSCLADENVLEKQIKCLNL